MSFASTAALGALAGGTIFLGLPLGRLTSLTKKVRVALSMFAVGILAFLFVDVLSHGFDIVDHALAAYKAGNQSIWRTVGLTALLGVGFTLGSAGLAMLEQRFRPARPRPPVAGGATETLTTADLEVRDRVDAEARRWALRVALTMPAANRVHPFADGTPVGVPARPRDDPLVPMPL